MAHTFTKLLTHIIFSAKNRVSSITPELKPPLYAYMAGILRELGGKALAINGTSDHVHILIMLPPRIALSETLRVLKTNSSRWVNQQPQPENKFEWQERYGAFSVSSSNIEAVIKYIADQETHHKKISFQEELVAFLRRNGIEYDPRFIWE